MSSENSQAALQGMTDSDGRFPSSRLCPYIPGGFRQHTLRTVPLAPKKRNAAWKIPAGAQVGRRSPSLFPAVGTPNMGHRKRPSAACGKTKKETKWVRKARRGGHLSSAHSRFGIRLRRVPRRHQGDPSCLCEGRTPSRNGKPASFIKRLWHATASPLRTRVTLHVASYDRCH